MDNQLIKELGHTLLQSRQAATLVLTDESLSLSEMLALGSIEHNAENSADNVYADDLQKLLCVSKPAISQMLKSFEKAGYITREINSHNRRKLNVILTQQGREVLHGSVYHYKNILTRIIHAYGEEKTRRFITMFSEFADTIRDVQREL